eukprot:scaffold266166_cov63-Attheya_sp.AAC.5
MSMRRLAQYAPIKYYAAVFYAMFMYVDVVDSMLLQKLFSRLMNGGGWKRGGPIWSQANNQRHRALFQQGIDEDAL